MKLSSIIGEILMVLPADTRLAYSQEDVQVPVEKSALYFWIDETVLPTKGLYIGKHLGVSSCVFFTQGKGTIRIYENRGDQPLSLEEKAEAISSSLKTLSFITSVDIGARLYDEIAQAFYLDVRCAFSYPEIRKEE